MSGNTQRRREPGQVSSVAAKSGCSTPVDVRAVAIEVLRLLLAMATKPEGWSTKRGHEHPNYSRDAWRRIAHAIGVRRGRYYFVSHEALAAYEGRAQEPAPRPASTWTPETAAAEMSLRVVEGGRR